jgi:hypothetical protein
MSGGHKALQAPGKTISKNDMHGKCKQKIQRSRSTTDVNVCRLAAYSGARLWCEIRVKMIDNYGKYVDRGKACDVAEH